MRLFVCECVKGREDCSKAGCETSALLSHFQRSTRSSGCSQTHVLQCISTEIILISTSLNIKKGGRKVERRRRAGGWTDGRADGLIPQLKAASAKSRDSLPTCVSEESANWFCLISG